ncbi:MAG: TetR/AcrR family transcriptional regulator [Candidatus Cloacimonetes bacterium]|nr:TetR/AcrR family transcriptional regulator [Candidatus Cloacimonadota bacterium]
MSGATKMMQRKKEKKRKAILDAAITVFSSHGYRKARVADIASQAKVGDGTIYLYYPDKARLMMAVFRELIDTQLNAWKEQIDPQQSNLEQLQQFFYFHADFFTKNPNFARFYAIEMRQLPQLQQTDHSRWPLYNYHEAISSLIRNAISAGEIRKIDTDVFVSMLLGTMEYVLTEWVYHNYEKSLHSINAKLIDILHNGLKLVDKERLL